MSDTSENTFTSYLGPEFQQKLMWQILVEPEFAEKAVPNLAVEYFDDPNFKRLFLIILEYIREYGKVPNLQNHSIMQAIYQFRTPNNPIEEESLNSVIKRIELWNERVLNKQLTHDGDVVQDSTNYFIKQQEYRKLAENISVKVKTGDIRNKKEIAHIEDKFQKIAHIGEDEDFGTEICEGIEKALRPEFRQTIPTGVVALDALTGGGLGKGEIGLILSPSGVGKAQPLSSKILTPNGWITMGEVKEGNLVIGSDGKAQKVLGVFPQGKRDIFKIEFSDDTSVLCDKEHIWSVNTFRQRTDKHKLGGITYYSPDDSYIQLTTAEMIDDFILINRCKTVHNYRLPNVMPVDFNERELKIHPYVMGALLGDGCLAKSNQPHIITTDKYMVDKICNLYSKTRVVEFEGRKENYLKIYRVLLLESKLLLEREFNLYGKLSYEKEIPGVYLYNTLQNRIELLQGLIDTDGTVGTNGTIIYTTTSNKLAIQVRELVLSLGGTCHIRNKKKQYNKGTQKVYGRESYNITISFPEDANVIPCSLPRKLERVRYRTKYSNNKFIKNISFSHEEEAQCIYVENDDHLYVTDDYVLTHNTTLLTKIANTARDLDYNVLQIIFEDTEDQIKRKHYSIWTKTALSAMDANRDAVLETVNGKIESMGSNGKLVIKRFSQEDTTMRDIRTWIVGYQKRFGFKFDIVVLDYLDCLDSHKKTQDRNEAELVIVKSFEAMAGDFNIPCWTAIQSNRSGFDAEIVDASQSGGSIKRLQKAHLFMSIAKTPDQKEASLATIKIIKARFAQDGQIFRDCIFNNDTMEIVIRDSGYVGGNYTNKTKYGDLVAAQYGTAPSIHGVISSVLPTEPEVDADMDKMRQAYIENFNIETKKTENDGVSDAVIEGVNDGVKPNTETDNTVITRYFTDPNTLTNNTETPYTTGTNPHISGTDINHPNNKHVTETTVSDAIDNGLFEIEDKPIEKNVVGCGQNIGLGIEAGYNIVPACQPIFEWTGETYTTATTEVEVKYEDIPAKVEEEPPMIVRYFDMTPPEVPVQPEVSVVEIAPKVEVVPKPPINVIQKTNIVELEKRLVDEDDIPNHDRTVFDMLRNMSKSQNVVKRE